jgi:enoyl-CoA hydratase/carnithine racemase
LSDTLLFEIRDHVATITLNRPEKLNAFTDSMLDAWIEALEYCRVNDQVRAVVITGSGRAFCSGGDVGGFKDRATATPAEIKRRLAEGTQRLPRKMAQVDKPLIAAINGAAYGGGLDVALMCDVRIAAQGAKLAETYARMGLVPGAGGAWYLPRLIGTARALEMLWTGEPISAQEAERIGLVNRVVPDAELMEHTMTYANKIAAGAPLSMRLIKKIVYQGLTLNLDDALDLAASNMSIVRTSEDHLEAVAAFKDKRRPVFKGQ